MSCFRSTAAPGLLPVLSMLILFGVPGAGLAGDDRTAPADVAEVAQSLERHPTYVGATWVVVPLRPGLNEGWHQTLSVYAKAPADGQYHLWIQNGWFYVRRSDKNDELEWQVKLASREEMGVPVISRSHPTGGELEVRSANGRYFVRDLVNSLRSVRQLSDKEGAVPHAELFDETFTTDTIMTGDGLVRSTATVLHDEAWRFIAIGPDRDQINCVVRLCPMDMPVTGVGSGALNEVKHFDFGGAELWDDGEMLLAVRKLPRGEPVRALRRQQE